MHHNSKKKVAVVTGGGSGIGSSIAIILDSLGYNVIISGRKEKKLKDIASKGRNISYILSNITIEKDIKALRKRAFGSWGRIDCLINNAGIL